MLGERKNDYSIAALVGLQLRHGLKRQTANGIVFSAEVQSAGLGSQYPLEEE